MSFEAVYRRTTTAPGLRRTLSRAGRVPAIGLAAGLTASAQLAGTWRLRRNRDLALTTGRRVGQSVGAAFLAAGLLIGLARWQAGSSWVDVAALSALLLVATSAMFGMSRALGDGADRTLVVLMAGWTASLVVAIGLWSTPLRENPLLSLAALVMAALMAGLGEAITYLLTYTITRLIVTPLER